MSYLDRGFGVEIECYLPEDSTREQLALAVSQRLGVQESCIAEDYTHVARSHWKIVTDGSLTDYTRGIELVSPILRGQAGLADVEKVCSALTDFGCTVNKKCGLHIHVGVDQAPLNFWKNLISMYSVFESVIDKMMPQSRRESNNMYCRSLSHVRNERVQAATSFDAISNAIGTGRYSKVNMSAYLRHGTVEFRQHSGTTDANKVCKWAIICLKMVEEAFQDRFVHRQFLPVQNMAKFGTKNYLVGQMLLRSEGVTSTEACAVTGWTSISIPEIARICGINFTSRKTGRLTRYFAATTSRGTSIDSFASLISLSDNEKSYVQQRINDLSGQVSWAA